MQQLSLAAIGAGFLTVAAVLAPPAAAQTDTAETGVAAGDELYATNCALCHGAEGEAVTSMFPNLVGSPNLEDPYNIVVNVIAGVAVMPAFPWLTDAEIAALANHVRNSWGNAHGDITADEVAVLRTELDPPGEIATIWDGVYTEAQAEQGAAVYNGACAMCHGGRLDGAPDDGDMLPAPPLARYYFLQNWDGVSLGALFSYTRATMPKSNPSYLNDEDYAAIVAHMLATTGAPAGDVPLSSDPLELGLIRIGANPD